MTNRQQSGFFIAIIFLFTCGAALLVFKSYSAYYEDNTANELQGGILVVSAHKQASSTPIYSTQAGNPSSVPSTK